MALNSTPLVGTGPTRKGQPEVGDLVTVSLNLSFDGSIPPVKCGAVVERIAANTFFVRLGDLEVPPPYKIGDRLPLNREAVVDW